MRSSPLFLIALAAVSALSATVTLTHYSIARSAPSEYRLVEPKVKLLKPSRPAREPRLQEKRPSGPALKNLTTAPTTGGTGNPKTPSQLANLVVIPFYNNAVGLPEGFPEHSYCVKKPTGGTPNQIKFYIRNAGGSDTGSFQWTPSFPNAGAAPATVIANIPANGQVLITQGIPNGCYTPGFSGVCQFSIHLDDHDEVEEWSESNTFESYCVSPAG